MNPIINQIIDENPQARGRLGEIARELPRVMFDLRTLPEKIDAEIRPSIKAHYQETLNDLLIRRREIERDLRNILNHDDAKEFVDLLTPKV